MRTGDDPRGDERGEQSHDTCRGRRVQQRPPAQLASSPRVFPSCEARWLPSRIAEQEDLIVFAPAHRHGDRPILEQPDHPDQWRGDDRAFGRLVVERHVARHDRNAQQLTSLAHPGDRLGERPVARFGLRRAEVQAVGCADGGRARAGDVQRRLEDRCLRRQSWVERRQPARSVQRHRQRARGALDAQQRGVRLAGTGQGIGPIHVVVSAPDRLATSTIGRR